MEERPKIPQNNLTALYKSLEERGNPPGILWSESVIKLAHKLQQQANHFNELEELLASLTSTQEASKSDSDSKEATSRERVDALQKSLEDFKPGSTYQVPSIFGDLLDLAVPEVSRSHQLLIVFKGIVELSQLFKYDTQTNLSNKELALYYLETTSLSRHKRELECQHNSPPWKFWKHSWDTGAWHDKEHVWHCAWDESDPPKLGFIWKDIRTLSEELLDKKKKYAMLWKARSDRLRKHIREHADQLKDVDKIICFALGPPNHGYARSFVQHLAARTVADTLEELSLENGSAKKITVMAQDPAYCAGCATVLEKELDIKAVTDLEGFLNVDQNTFVLTFCPTGPIPAIIADLTRQSGGPAAMLCDRIDDDYMRPERDGKDRIADMETKNLVEWKKRCSGEEFGDAKDILGMSHEEHQKCFPVRPVNMPIDSDREKQYKAFVTEEYRKAAQVNFRDAWLYVMEE